MTLLNTGEGTQIPVLALALPAAAAANFRAITELRAYTSGAFTPIGSVTTMSVNYTRTSYRNVGGDSRILGLAAIGGIHNLSRQTTLYGTVGVHTGDLQDHINDMTVFQVGPRKAF